MHNAQPWLFGYRRSSGELTLRADLARTMPRADPAMRGLHLGCGAALFNLRVAAAHGGRSAALRLLPDPADPLLLAVCTFSVPVRDDTPTDLFPAIRRRRTNRQPFSGEPVAPELRDALSAAARLEGARLAFAGSWHAETLVDLVRTAEAEEATVPAVRRELAQWVATTAERGRADGIPPAAFGPRRYGGKAPVRDFATATAEPTGRPAAVFEETPCLAVLETADDSAPDWLRAGQALERVWLQATADGLAVSVNSQAFEWPELRWAARDPRSGRGRPQLMLRFGYGPEVPATPRRDLSEVLEIR
ncbi:nitroreductase [Streptomyces solincola]|uniref:Nitroreductase n=2 Tax=Streptomyces solincola TaxID=2100817 RepID=A0A2S9Q2C8_9ACTN|nr:nitroreductase [Streptomyces solincola]